jgi:hypothetical protein
MLDINDNTYEINVINSSALKPRRRIDKNMVVDDISEKTDFQFQNINRSEDYMFRTWYVFYGTVVSRNI